MTHPVASLDYQVRRTLVTQLAPRYREASLAQKTLLLDTLVELTGYARKYAIELLNQVPQSAVTLPRTRLPFYGPEIQQALCVAWKAADHICAKRLVPFLPSLVASLEHHGRLQLTEEARRRLLAMSVTTAERFLRTQRKPTPCGLSTTKAGTLLKQQIPIRTFQEWENVQPGFLEVDVVAHCGGNTEGSYLSTLTLTDVATGWTECLPLLSHSSDRVLAAFQRALFPFPILGIDTDNGREFINGEVMAYCEQEHLTFTRGRPGQKDDQCFVEQKNGAIVRHVVGYDRLVGEPTYQQLRELYRALRLYVNCFQPSMKLLSKQREGRKYVRYVYDPAKTPLQRLVLSGVLSAAQQQELNEIAQALDPISLFEQLEQLQRAIFRCCAGIPAPAPETTPSALLLRFSVEDCLAGTPQSAETATDPATLFSTLRGEQRKRTRFLNWQRRRNNPFAEEWERILAWVRANPDGHARDLFQELQRQSPGRYHASQFRTLQHAIRTLRAFLLTTSEEPWLLEVIHGPFSDPGASQPGEHEAEPPTATVHLSPPSSPVSSSPESASATPIVNPPPAEEEATHPAETATSAGKRLPPRPPEVQGQVPSTLLACACKVETLLLPFPGPTIEQAIQSFLHEEKLDGRTDKTIEWHQTALRSFQQYLTQHHRNHPREMTTAQAHAFCQRHRAQSWSASDPAHRTRGV